MSARDPLRASAHDRPTSGRARSLRGAALTLAVLTLGGLAPLACGQGTYSVNSECPKLAAATGGDPLGKWKVESSCQVPYARTTADDWCQKLVYGANGVADGLFLGTEILPIVGTSAADPTVMSQITYSTDHSCGNNCGTYEATLVFEGRSTTNFPLGCLRQHIANPTCDDLGAKIETLVNVLPMIQDVHCTLGANDSCDCSYIVTTATIASDAGAWRIQDNLLVHYPQTLAAAGFTDFAVIGNELQLHGHDGEPLLAHDPLRNLTLTRE